MRNTLTTVSRDDGRVQNWRISGSNGVMDVGDSRQPLKLHDNGSTQCKSGYTPLEISEKDRRISRVSSAR